MTEYRKLLSSAQDILDSLSHFRVTLAEEVQSKSDTVAVLQKIDRNIHDICDRIFLAFYRISPFIPLPFIIQFNFVIYPSLSFTPFSLKIS